MGMTGSGLAAARKAAQDAVACNQTSTGADAVAYREALLQADSEAIVTYIQQNAKATGTDTGTYGGDSHNLSIV